MSKTILFIDNSLSNQLDFKSTFINKYKVICASFLDEAHEIIHNEKIDLLIINLSLSEIKDFITTHLDLKKILICSMPLTNEELRKYHINKFILSPYTSLDLSGAINEILPIENFENVKTSTLINPNMLNIGYMELEKTIDSFNITFLNRMGYKILQLYNIENSDFFTTLKVSKEHFYLLSDILKYNLYFEENLKFNERNYRCIFSKNNNKLAINFILINENNISSCAELFTLTNSIAFEYDVITNTFISSQNFHLNNCFSLDKNSIFNPNFSYDGIHTDDIEIFKNDFINPLKNGNTTVKCVVRLLMPDNNYRFNCIICNVKYNSINQRTKVIGIIKDIDEERKYQEHIKYLSMFDQLTGIYNKQFFEQETIKLLKNNTDKTFHMLRIDIAKFKIVNELFGIREGDNLLCHISNYLKNEFKFKNNVTYGRFGADIFYICICCSHDEIINLIKRIEDNINQLKLSMKPFTYFGIYKIENFNESINSICDKASLAASYIKNNFLIHYSFYTKQMHEELIFEQKIANDMNSAITNDNFLVYLQPKINLINNSIIGAEALIRWNHPTEGFIPPNKFIPILEKNSFILTLDLYVIEKVCQTIKKWIDAGLPILPISCNLSKVDFYNPQLLNLIIDICTKYNIPHKYIELEITETSISEDKELILNFINDCKKYGFKTLMDDFGNGSSSLNMLKDTDVDIIKIDLNFLKNENNCTRSTNILSGIIQMTNSIGTPCIVEGVEKEEQASLLRSLGCVIAQGFLFYKPLSISEYENIIKDNVVAFNE